MLEQGVKEACSPTEVWTEEVVGLAKEAVLTFFEHGPHSEQHLEASQQLWVALEVFAMVQQALRDGGEVALKPADGALDRSGEWVPPSRPDQNCGRCGRVLTPEALEQGKTECSSHTPGKVEVRRPGARS